VFERIRATKDRVLFLVFNPGPPSSLSEIKVFAEEQEEAVGNLFSLAAPFPMIRRPEILRPESNNDSVLTQPNRLITGSAAYLTISCSGKETRQALQGFTEV
jgi:hypothetical protein